MTVAIKSNGLLRREGALTANALRFHRSFGEVGASRSVIILRAVNILILSLVSQLEEKEAVHPIGTNTELEKLGRFVRRIRGGLSSMKLHELWGDPFLISYHLKN